MSDPNNPEHVEEEAKVPIKTAGMLKAAIDEYKNSKIIAFLGNSESGKTVAATLLKDAFFSNFIPKHSEKFAGHLVSGYDILSSTEDSLFSGTFPDPTPEGSTYEIEFEISNKEFSNLKSNIKIRDINGEDYNELILGPDISPATRIREILKRGKPDSYAFGPMSYLIFANVYVLLIDCELFPDWRKLDLRQAQAINSILQFKQAISETEINTILSPVAILLTKADQLPDEVTDTPKELIEKNMPQFYHALCNKVSGSKEFFKSDISVEKTESALDLITQANKTVPLPNKTVPLPNKPKIKQPLDYSSDEYVKLILWFLKNIQ